MDNKNLPRKMSTFIIIKSPTFETEKSANIYFIAEYTMKNSD